MERLRFHPKPRDQRQTESRKMPDRVIDRDRDKETERDRETERQRDRETE